MGSWFILKCNLISKTDLSVLDGRIKAQLGGTECLITKSDSNDELYIYTEHSLGNLKKKFKKFTINNKQVHMKIKPYADTKIGPNITKKQSDAILSSDTVLTCLFNKKSQLKRSGRSADPENINIRTRVTPLYMYSYPTQLLMKEQYARTIRKQILKKLDEREEGLSLDVKVCPIIPSPDTHRIHYRNKVELTIGYAFEEGHFTEKPMIGFVKSSKDFEPILASPSGMCHINQRIPEICEHAKKMLLASSFKPATRKQRIIGHWRSLQIRSFEDEGQYTFMLSFLVAKLQASNFERLKNEILDYFGSLTILYGSEIRIGSIYIMQSDDLTDTFTELAKYTCIFGKEKLSQQLLGLKFFVNPFSFFQTNIGGARMIYTATADALLENIDIKSDDKFLCLDICCGTGTIGQIVKGFMLGRGMVCDLIGIDIVQSAITMAVENAKVNFPDENCNQLDPTTSAMVDITYICEDVKTGLPKVFEHMNVEAYKSILCLVDPARPGLPSSAIRAIVDSAQIERVVYVSCNPESLIVDTDRFCSAANNFLAVERGKRLFKLVCLTPVDMFPHTNHVEMIAIYDRQDSSEDIPSKLKHNALIG